MKNIFSLKSISSKESSSDKKSNPVQETEEKEKVKISIVDKGREDSLKNQGNEYSFKASLDALFQTFKKDFFDEEGKEDKMKEQKKEECQRREIELKKLDTGLTIKEESILRIEEQIKHLENEKFDAPINPESYGIESSKKPKAQFWIGLFVLLPVTIYLIVFYMSASYSAFFKDFEDNELFAAILDAQALTKAFRDGWLEVLFVCTIPFVFMGLGYLIHMFQKQTSKVGRFKIIMLFSVTFVFDVILAYLIEKKIYDFNRTLASEDFDFIIAIGEVSFWGIIFAGFVVYIIWGLIFDFIMKEYEDIDKIKKYIQSINEKIIRLKQQKQSQQETINEFKEKTHVLRTQIEQLKQFIDSKVISYGEYKLYHSHYTQGWFYAIQSLMVEQDKKDRLLMKCNEIADSHLENVMRNSKFRDVEN